MSEVSSKEFVELNKMLPEERLDYTLAQMIEKGFLWGLFGTDGWVMLKADDDVCMPIWPCQTFATAWVKNDFPNCEPRQIEFTDWLETWLPGMQSNNTLILVFPLGDDEEGIMLEASEMLECIEEDLANLAENKKD
ncbi:MAG: DUF2750 domain-containing protein [Paraglaciecola sp.]|uniref:DUF2750 domain-containing protein n=1 Tax=Paraglaciecola sp. TaxID=1920173 RepID=UPI00273E27F9|nr:DUF2750 domain-containing protein [Paraglaciecola sp.]MDP5031217.1 DUF2750 domain-containing protein [Paraglaciecola sp.]MDP5134120.1 DUF2750 domain-containing protein [Paraglaciecola sp.]